MELLQGIMRLPSKRAHTNLGRPNLGILNEWCPWFLLVTTNRTQNCDSEIVSGSKNIHGGINMFEFLCSIVCAENGFFVSTVFFVFAQKRNEKHDPFRTARHRSEPKLSQKIFGCGV
jgi:hypothetical protein